MPTIGWDETRPQDTDSAGLGDDEIRSLKTALRTGLDGEHVWPSGGGDAGVHRLGSARAYYGTQSRVSSSGTDGRLMVTSDSSRIFHVGSTATAFLGGPTVISAGSFPGAVPQRHYWAIEFGSVAFGSEDVTVTIPNSGYSGIPFVTASLATTASTIIPSGGINSFAYGIAILDKTASDFLIHVTVENGSGAAVDGARADWMSIGTRVF